MASILWIEANKELLTQNQWQKQVETILSKPRYSLKRSGSQYVIIFSLQSATVNNFYYNTSYRYSLLPYALNAKQLPGFVSNSNDTIETNKALRDYLQNNDSWKELPSRYLSSRAINGCINLETVTISLINAVIDYKYNNMQTGVLMDQLATLGPTGVPIFRGEGKDPFIELMTFSAEPISNALVLEYQDGQLTLSVQTKHGDQLLPLGTEGNNPVLGSDWLITNSMIAPVGDKFDKNLLNSPFAKDGFFIPSNEQDLFFERYFPALAQNVDVVAPFVKWVDIQVEQPQKQIYLSEKNDTLFIEPHFDYDGYVLPYDEHAEPQAIIRAPQYDADGQIAIARVNRDLEFEQETKRSLGDARYGLKQAPKNAEPNSLTLRSHTDPIDFLIKKLPLVIEDGYEIFGEDKLKIARVNRTPPSISFNISSGIDWFDVGTLITFGDIPVNLADMRHALRKQYRYVKLSDGSMGQIPDEWVEKYKHLFELGEQSEKGTRLSNHHLTLIDQLLSETQQSQTDEQYQQRLQQLKNFTQIEEMAISPNFNGTLHPYQKAGFDWLHFLNQFNYGGCLADDMGLGKTIQVLAFLQSLREQQPDLPPDLIVLPPSLLYNWQREIEKFTPNLRSMIYSGQTRNKEIADYFGQYDIILTTYGLVRSDIEIFHQYLFHYVILDESQVIKNPNTKIAKAVRVLKSQRRLVVTGTPVENSTFELWSQLAFLNPGLLGDIEYFREAFATPIQAKGDEKSADLLRKMVYPFIMRRTKDQVASDLPPRTEQIIYIDMEPAQRKLYEKTRDDYRNQILDTIQAEGINSARFKLLEGLLRLRQICNHAKLVQPSFRGDSGKLILLMETLESLASEGHKVLIFSQFVQMLKLIEEEIKKQEFKYVYLDGQTRKRQEQVDQFQEDETISFFLISLKAGGVGLNLTAADYIIHVDPWWNPAVEMQATDRAHRIGQDKPVFVYKLITQDSIEEKVLQLQEKKRQIVEQIISAESGFFKDLSTDDIQVLFS